MERKDDFHSGIADGSTCQLEWARRFQHIVESGDINAKLKPKYDLKRVKDGIKFKKFILEQVDKYQTQKFVKNKWSKSAHFQRTFSESQ